MSTQQDTKLTQFEQDLLEAVRQAQRDEGRVTTAEEIKRRMGRPPQAIHKAPVTLRLDPQALARWRASGKGWQTRAAALLASHAPAISEK